MKDIGLIYNQISLKMELKEKYFMFLICIHQIDNDI
jgi:hypothetical protein